MSPIHQIYCTHCTYGSSALEQREGELAERVLGYSARASSLERTELRNYYRQVERFLYYYLPTDTPTEEKLRLDAATAPRRLFYSPAIGDIQVLGQISYRQQDTAGRPGSYFGHVLFGPRATPWSPLDCLQLWGAPWADEDSANLSPKLPELQTLGGLLNGSAPAIDDKLLWTFLNTPLGEAFDDPRQVIPERWRYVAPAERGELLAETLQGFLNLGSQRRENLLLVIEPSLSALVFYGVARLLPPGAVRESISFSTFEPNADRLPVSLAATTFHAPETTDLRPDAYRRRGYVYNTFINRHSDHGRPEGHYGRLLVGTLLASGFGAVDQLFGGFHSSGAKTPEDLELLADVHQLVGQVLDPAAPLGETRWRQSDVATRYLSQAVHLQLANDSAGWPQLRALIGSPNQLLVMELIASAPAAADIHGPLQFLLRKLPADKFGELLASTRLPRSAKIEALAFYLSSAGRFPENCESLWSEGSRLSSIIAGRAEPLLPSVLARLPAQVIGPLYRTLAPEQSELFLLAVVRGGRPEPDLQAALRAVVGDILKEFDDAPLLAWLTDHRDELRSFFPPPDDVLRPRLARLLFEIPDHPRQLEARLDALEGWVDYFSEPALAERRVVQWQKIRSILLAIREAELHKPKNRLEAVFRKTKPPDYRALAEALQSAMPISVYQDDLRGTRKLDCLRELGRALVGNIGFLTPVVRSRLVRFFEYGDWSEFAGARSKNSKPGNKGGKRGAAARRNSPMPLLIAFGGSAALVALAGGIYFSWTEPERPGGAATTAAAASVATNAADGARAPTNRPSNDAPQKTPRAASSEPTSPEQVSPGPKTKPAASADSAEERSAQADRRDGPATETPKSPEAQTPPETPASSEKPAPEMAPSEPPPKPAAGETPPAAKGVAPAPEAEARPARRDARRRVSDYKELPALSRSPSVASKPAKLIPWSERPEQAKLSLHGLDFANARLQERSPSLPRYPQLALEARDKGQWAVVARICTPQSSGPTKDLATFAPTPEALEFRWSEGDRSPELTVARDWLRTCVLEFERDAARDVLLLAAPETLAELHPTFGTAKFNPGKVGGLPARSFGEVDLQIASCTVNFGQSRLTFAGGEQPVDPIQAEEILSEYDVGAVRVVLNRDPKKQDFWQLSLEIDAPASLLEQRRACEQQQDEMGAINAELAAYGKAETSPERKQEAIRTLARLLKVDIPAKDGAKPGDDAAQKGAGQTYDQAVEKQILAPARARGRSLQNDLRRSRMELTAADEQFKLKSGNLRSRASAISAVLTRRVGKQIVADCLIIGDPEPIDEPQPDDDSP
ncbi:MAG TPA: hypothetical protein VMV10_04135 [Pirellulales bacterium]|nr:hypothetical protein [Pirellulales bacterium]